MQRINRSLLLIGMLWCLVFNNWVLAAASEGNRGTALLERLKAEGTVLWFAKSEKACRVIKDGKIIASYQAVFGVNPQGDKVRQGDCKTPEGMFYIIEQERLFNHPYLGKKWFGLSYPDIGHAEQGLQKQLISAVEYQAIIQANNGKYPPPQNTALGGYIGIHGGREDLTRQGINWTEGCIAMLDEDLEKIYNQIDVGTAVYITK
jgi:murein L,D-transpeptidase YafK